MALRYDEYLAAGAVIAVIDIDSPAQHAAMVEKLNLPFPMLSDPDRSVAITPYDLVDEVDRRNLAIPATVVIDADGNEIWRRVSRDYADRPPEDEALDVVRSLQLEPAARQVVEPGTPEAGPRAMPFQELRTYFRGAKFAARAMGSRFPEARDDALVFSDLMDRYMEDVTAMYRIKRDQGTA